jgi:hypothetical protein
MICLTHSPDFQRRVGEAAARIRSGKSSPLVEVILYDRGCQYLGGLRQPALALRAKPVARLGATRIDPGEREIDAAAMPALHGSTGGAGASNLSTYLSLAVAAFAVSTFAASFISGAAQ